MEVTAALHRQHQWNHAGKLWSTLELCNTEGIACAQHSLCIDGVEVR